MKFGNKGEQKKMRKEVRAIFTEEQLTRFIKQIYRLAELDVKITDTLKICNDTFFEKEQSK